MKLEELKLLVKEGEGLTVEFKERYSSKIVRDLVAFANSKSGAIALGVKDNGTVAGEKLTNKMKAEILALARNCEPEITVNKISQVGKAVVIEIPEGDEKPYSCSSGYFRRLDAVTQKMSQKEVRAIFREAESISFENLFNSDFRLADISLKKIKVFLKEAETSYKINKSNLISFLSSLGIYQKDRINNAGVLMFASRVEKFIPYSEIILIACKGKNKSYIYDRKDVRDDLMTQLSEAEMFVKKHLNVRSEIHGMNRHDIYEIPLNALREALVNAIIHRDYNMRGTSIYVEVYDDRVVVVNPGGTPTGITKSNFGKESIRRNLIVADLFHRMGKVERVGSGIAKMRDLMKKADLKKPVFESENFFRVTFYRDPRYSLKLEDMEKPQETTQKTTQETTQKTDQKILQSIRNNPYITRQELVTQIGNITDAGIKYQLKQLKEKGKLKRIGPTKGGHWEVIEK